MVHLPDLGNLICAKFVSKCKFINRLDCHWVFFIPSICWHKIMSLYAQVVAVIAAMQIETDVKVDLVEPTVTITMVFQFYVPTNWIFTC